MQTKLAFGGRVRVLSSGAAPLPKHVEEFIRVTSCSSLSQGYGMSVQYKVFDLTNQIINGTRSDLGTIKPRPTTV